MVLSNKADPDLNQGCAYFVEEKEYKEYLEVHKTDSVPVCCHIHKIIFSSLTVICTFLQKSICPCHDAVNPAGKDHAASGTGMIECTWHNMKHPNMVGDLQKGEW